MPADLFLSMGTQRKVVCDILNISDFCRFSHATRIPSVSEIFAKDNSALFTYGSFAVLFTTEL